MPFCHNCGKEVQPGVKFCPNCGAPLEMGAVASKIGVPSAGAGGRTRPALATVFIIGYIGLGTILVFLGGASLFFSIFFTPASLALILLIFLGVGVFCFLTVYGFLKGGRWASTYVTATGILCIIAGAIFALPGGSLAILGAVSFVIGAGTLGYLRFGDIRTYWTGRN